MIEMLTAGGTKALPAADIKEMVISSNSVAILKNNGDLYGYGSNTNGKFGTGTAETRIDPARKVLSGVNRLYGNDTILMAIMNNGAVMMSGKAMSDYFSQGAVLAWKDVTQYFNGIHIGAKSISFGTLRQILGIVDSSGNLWQAGAGFSLFGDGTTSSQVFKKATNVSNIKSHKYGHANCYCLTESGELYGGGNVNNQQVPSESYTLLATQVVDFMPDYSAILYSNSSGVFVRGYINNCYGLANSGNSSTFQKVSLPDSYSISNFRFVQNNTTNLSTKKTFISLNGNYYSLCDPDYGVSGKGDSSLSTKLYQKIVGMEGKDISTVYSAQPSGAIILNGVPYLAGALSTFPGQISETINTYTPKNLGV